MKRVVAIIQPFKLEEVGEALRKVGISGVRRPPKTGESGPGLYEHRLIGGFLSGRPASISF
jgi:hypothetical protein